ncbi:MAG: hypothetical protein WKG03_11775 [Telluria sp.]
MNFKLALALAILAPQAAFSASISGKLVAGGGGDYMSITVKNTHGKQVKAFCVEQCDAWFVLDKDDVSHLRKELVGKKVAMEYHSEKNNGRMESYGEGSEKFNFVKKVSLVK